MTSLKNISIVLGIVISLTVVMAKVSNIDARYAKAAEVEQIAKRLDNKIIQDRMEKIQERMWAMEDRWGKGLPLRKIVSTIPWRNFCIS